MTSLVRVRLARDGVAAALVGAWAAAVALVPDPIGRLVIAGPVAAAALAWWIILSAERWVAVFFFCAILLPPLPVPLGNSGVHLAPLIALGGLYVGLLRMPEWRRWDGPLPLLFFVFLAVLAGSTGFAALYSGWSIGIGSLARVLLFAISAYVFMFTFAGPQSGGGNPIRQTRLLFFAGMLAALFACVDFYFQLPAPAGYGAQFIWVGQDVFRRAQGLFYEASTLGNFCAFFLVMILVSFFRRRDERPCSRLVLALGGTIFSTALIFSYSRASLVTIAVAACAFAYVRRLRIGRTMLGLLALAAVAAILANFALPTLSSHYWTRLQTSFRYFGASPDSVLSGRLESWTGIARFLIVQPWQVFFGIGYKTLPYTDYVSRGGLVADNTYLSLLVETGIVGLLAFLSLNFAILRTALAAARSARPAASFFGSWIFCFWCGEIVQMLSGDLITYWRVLPIYFWVLAKAAREASR